MPSCWRVVSRNDAGRFRRWSIYLSPEAAHDVHMTYSIVARDPTTGQMGVAAQSCYFALGSVVPWARAAWGPSPPNRWWIPGTDHAVSI